MHLFSGFVKFLGPYYMLLITKRKKVGNICGHTIYAVSKSDMIAIPNSTVRANMAYSRDENRSFVHSACKNMLLTFYFFMETITSLRLQNHFKLYHKKFYAWTAIFDILVF